MKMRMRFGDLIDLEVEGGSAKEIFGELGIFAEVEPKCGNCGSEKIIPKVRTTAGGDSYYDFVCQCCKYTFPVGQKKGEGGVLFPGRLIKDPHTKEVVGKKLEWEPPFQPKGDAQAPRQSQRPAATRPATTTDADDDIPF